MNDIHWLNESEDRAWRAYTEMSARLNAYLHRSLSGQTGLSLSDFEVLVHLSESPHGRLRAFELGAALQWEKSRLSHHLTRMERRRLVERQLCESDGRGLFVVLSPEGRKAIEAAAPHHVTDVRQRMIDLLTPGELVAMATIAEKVIAGLPTDDDLSDSSPSLRGSVPVMTANEDVVDCPTAWVNKHIKSYAESGGEKGHRWNGVPTLLLTTRGRKSGKLRRTALIYGQDDDRYVVVASIGGAPRHPSWYLNLEADPEVRLQVGPDQMTGHARTATGAERERLWQQMAGIWPQYDQYQQKTQREIPVVVVGVR